MKNTNNESINLLKDEELDQVVGGLAPDECSAGMSVMLNGKKGILDYSRGGGWVVTMEDGSTTWTTCDRMKHIKSLRNA